MLAEFGTFCDEAQAVKVHIGAGENPDESLVFAAVLLDVVFNACDRKGAGRFKNASRILEDVLDRSTDFVCVHQHDTVYEILAKHISLLADKFDRRAVGEEADIGN